ncbi:DUF4282 domain-containing protein [Actinomadura sp. SCN-SB]|uniref:DUF4282 domain-containing protein n=1 Tax=Actinomadura sp. SCN-SB TaxID=3373092 RepID=UPI00374FEDFC
MANPPDHGQGPGSFGPPPRPHPGRVPEPRAPGPVPDAGAEPLSGGPDQEERTPQQEWAPRREEWAPPPPRTDKGLFGALFDADFDHLITPKLVKLWYVLGLLLITLQCVILMGFGLWVATWDDWWAWGLILAVASPLVWLFELLLVRIFMEAVVVRFKQADYLRAIKDKS